MNVINNLKDSDDEMQTKRQNAVESNSGPSFLKHS